MEQPKEVDSKASNIYQYNASKRLPLCVTCSLAGHQWVECTQLCDKCEEHHDGLSCRTFPDLYPKVPLTQKQTAEKRLKDAADAAERLVKERETSEVRRRKPAATVPQPAPGGALELLGVTKWEVIDPQWNLKFDEEKLHLKTQ
jgi:hypothetical protein